MTINKIFPIIIMVLAIFACITNIITNPTDWRHILYWACAAGITASVTF